MSYFNARFRTCGGAPRSRGAMSRRRVYAELAEDEYGNRPDIRFLPHMFKDKGARARA